MIMPNLVKLAQLEVVEKSGELNLVRRRKKKKKEEEDTFSGSKMPNFKQS